MLQSILIYHHHNLHRWRRHYSQSNLDLKELQFHLCNYIPVDRIRPKVYIQLLEYVYNIQDLQHLLDPLVARVHRAASVDLVPRPRVAARDSLS